MKKVKEIIKRFIVFILWYMPPVFAHKVIYRMAMKEKLDLKNPKTLNDKIHYIIAHKLVDKREAELTDKYLARNYITEKGYGEYLPKLYGVYENADMIDISKLPEKFVLKTNNGSGDVFICKDKKEFEKQDFRKVLNKDLKRNYAKLQLEYHYKYIKPLIVCEEYLNDGTGKAPIDYKFWGFNGKVDYILVCMDRETSVKYVYYDKDWNYMEDASIYKAEKLEKPKNFEKMLEIAQNLSKGFIQMRVDMYNIDGKIYIGEMTFTSHAGFTYYLSDKMQLTLGNEIKLDKDLKNESK